MSIGIEGSAGNTSQLQNVTASITTSGTNRIAMLFIETEQPGGPAVTVSSVTTTGLTWNKYTALTWGDTGTSYGNSEIWWAYVASANTYSIAIHLSTEPDDMCWGACAVSGLQAFSNPFDPNGSLPATYTNDTNAAANVAATFSTTTAATIAFGFMGSVTNGTFATPPAGWTVVNNQGNFNGGESNECYVIYQIYAAAQSGTTVTLTATRGNNGFIVTALTASPPTDSSTVTTTLKGIGQVCSVTELGKNIITHLGGLAQSLNATTIHGTAISTTLGGIGQVLHAAEIQNVTANPIDTKLGGIGQGVQAHIYRNAITTALQGLRQQALGYEGGGVVITTSLAGIAQLVRATESQYITIAQALRGIGQIVQALEKRNVTASLITTSLGGISQRVLTTIPAAPGQGAWWAWWSAIDDVAMISNPGMLPQSGTVWYNGVGPPSNAFGVTNDLYLDVSSGNVYLFGSNSWF